MSVLAADGGRDTDDVALDRLTSSLSHDGTVILGGAELCGESREVIALALFDEEKVPLLGQAVLLRSELDGLVASASLVLLAECHVLFGVRVCSRAGAKHCALALRKFFVKAGHLPLVGRVRGFHFW